MSPYHISVIRKGRRPADLDAEERSQRFVGDCFGLGDRDAAFLPPSTQVGWMESGALAGGLVYCLACSPQQPTSGHTQVYASSYFATMACTACRRRLDESR